MSIFMSFIIGVSTALLVRVIDEIFHFSLGPLGIFAISCVLDVIIIAIIEGNE